MFQIRKEWYFFVYYEIQKPFFHEYFDNFKIWWLVLIYKIQNKPIFWYLSLAET